MLIDSEYVIETANLNVYYGELKILDNINIRIPRNVVFAIMGPSGSGKSTLLRTFNKLILLNPDARIKGVVKLFGKNIYNPGYDYTEISKVVGIVFQTPNPFPHLSIYDNVALGLKLNGIIKSRNEMERRVQEALEKVGLWDEVKGKLKMPSTELSIGQKQRLCIARTLALKPKVILMDEPTSSLDPSNTRKIEDLIMELKREATVIIVTHSPAQAYRISDYVAFLFSGRLIEVGPTKELFENPSQKLLKDFLRGGYG